MADHAGKAAKKRTILSFFSPSKGNEPTELSRDSSSNRDEAQESRGSASSSEQPAPSSSTSEPTEKKRPRLFQNEWLRKFEWLSFPEEEGLMFCKLCTKHKKNNTFTSGSSNFRTSTLTRHADGTDHKAAVLAEGMKKDFQEAVKKVTSEKEESVKVAMKSVFWLARENISISKFQSILELLEHLECPHVSGLKASSSATYKSDKSASEMLQSIAHVIRSELSQKLDDSPFISILCDESTDIAVKKKLVVYCTILDPKTFNPSTHFLCNIEVQSANGEAIFKAITDVLESKKIEPKKVMALGSDGAKVMTGKGIGVTGFMLRQNPMLLNYHCIAHRLALVTSQAAQQVDYLVDYQQTLTGMFYFFKASANRTTHLANIQKLLDEPELKIKEVHEVRWLSIYFAVETVYKTLDSLISFFTTDKDAKSKGYQKKISQYDFLATTYLLMDILPIVSELCLVFQKSELDLPMVEVSVNHCKRSLEKLKDGTEAEQTYLHRLQNDHLSVKGGKLYFKDHHLVSGKNNIDSIKRKFIDAILERIDARFPVDDSNILYAFGVLGMRPISFFSQRELLAWGDDKLQILINQYGKEKVSQPRDSSETPVTVQAIVDAEETKKEWALVKPLVVNAGYPRDNMKTLWGLINKYHKDEFPNLLTLAALALTAPIHTADCERGFSAQNQIKTALRNRLSSTKLDDLLTVKLESATLVDFDFDAALKHWREEKQRKLFVSKHT